MNGHQVGFGLLAAMLISMGGCSPAQRHMSTIRLEVPPRSPLAQLDFLLHSQPRGLSRLPVSLDDVGCVSLNVTGDGIAPFASRFFPIPEMAATPFCNYGGILTKPISFVTGGVLEAEVPSGRRRRIQVLGFAPTVTGQCPVLPTAAEFERLLDPTTAGTSNGPDDLKPVVLGEAVKDIFEDVNVEIKVAYDPSQPKDFGTCFPRSNPTPQPSPSTSPFPFPTPTSTPSIPNIGNLGPPMGFGPPESYLIPYGTGCVTTGVDIRWMGVSGATGYSVEYTTSPNFISFTSLGNVGSPAYNFSGGTAGVTYRFRITPLGIPNAGAIVTPNFVMGANMLFVDPSRPDDTGDGCTPATAKQTLGGAVTTSYGNAVHDYILLRSGNYSPGSINISTYGLHILGGFNATYTDRAFSDGNDGNGIEGSVVTQSSACDGCTALTTTGGPSDPLLAVLDGLTLRNTGHVASGTQAGLALSTPTNVINCDIDGGTVIGSDGSSEGITAAGYQAVMQNNRIVAGSPTTASRTSYGISGAQYAYLSRNSIIVGGDCPTSPGMLIEIGAQLVQPGNVTPTTFIRNNRFELGPKVATCPLATPDHRVAALLISNASASSSTVTIEENLILSRNLMGSGDYPAIDLIDVNTLSLRGNSILLGPKASGAPIGVRHTTSNLGGTSIVNNDINIGSVAEATGRVTGLQLQVTSPNNLVTISNNTILVNDIARSAQAIDMSAIFLSLGAVSGTSITNNIFFVGNALTSAGKNRCSIEEYLYDAANSIENNAFIDPAGMTATLTYLKRGSGPTFTSAITLNGSRSFITGNIAMGSLPFRDPMNRDYRLVQGSLADQDWFNLIYGGRDTSQNVCGGTGFCGAVQFDRLGQPRTPVIGPSTPNNAGAAGVSMGAFEL